MYLNRSLQYTTSPANNIFARMQQERFKQTIMSAKNGGRTEATKRVVAQIPINAQAFTWYVRLNPLNLAGIILFK